MKKYLTVFILLLYSCNKENPTENLHQNIYSGIWDMTMSGDFSGRVTFYIDDNSEFKYNLTITTSTTTLYTTIEGNVSSNGTFLAIVKYGSDNSSIGQYNGTINDKNGAGTYTVKYGKSYSGTWTMMKQ